MKKVPLEEKDYLTVKAAVALFGLNHHKFLELITSEPQSFVVAFRSRRLILREDFARYLDETGRREELTNGRSGKRTAKRFEA